MAFFNVRKLASATLLTSLLLTTQTSLARIDVETLIASNLTPEQRDSLVELFRGAYADVSKAEVRVVPATAPAQPAIQQSPPVAPGPATDDPMAPQDSQSVQPQPAPQTAPQPVAPNLPAPEERVELSLVKLETRIQLRATRYNAEGRQVHSVSTMMASMDEAPEVMTRLATALYSLKSFEQTENLENITTEDTKKPKRKSAEFVGGVRIGLVAPVSKNQPINAYATIGFDGRVEAGENVIEFGAGFGAPMSDDYTRGGTWYMGGLYADLGYHRYLTPTVVSPYVGLGVQPRLWFSTGSSGINVVPYLQAGLMLLRDHSTRLYFEGRAGYNVVAVGRNDDGTLIRPWEFGGAVGIGF